VPLPLTRTRLRCIANGPGEDKVLTVEEWDRAIDARYGERPVQLAVPEWDADSDGTISRQEFEDAMNQVGLPALK
jgi:hypothetical protein